MATDINWHVDGDWLYMEATDSENGLTLDRDVVKLSAWMAQRMTGIFPVDTEPDTDNLSVKIELRKFARRNK